MTVSHAVVAMPRLVDHASRASANVSSIESLDRPFASEYKMNHWIDHRRSGVLLHISSLPGPFPGGVLGEEARAFIDIIADAGFSVWQFLPLGPTHGHGSPMNRSLLLPATRVPRSARLPSRGWLSKESCQATIEGGLSTRDSPVRGRRWILVSGCRRCVLGEEVDAFLRQNATGWMTMPSLWH